MASLAPEPAAGVPDAAGRSSPALPPWAMGATFLLFAALIAAPLGIDAYWMRVLSVAFMYATLAQAINLIAGFTGYAAFGNVVFFGIGSYSVAVVMAKLGGSFAIGVAAAVLLSFTTAVILGPILLRLRGHYFAIATVGLNEMVRAVVSNAEPLGAGMGLSLPLPPWSPQQSALTFYYLLLVTLLLSVVIATWFKLSRLGLACRAIRDDESKAEAMGIRTTMVKTIAWATSAVLTSITGGIYAYWFSYIDPPSVFDLLIAIKSFVVFLLGGAATILGPVLAALLVEYLSTIVSTYLLHFHLGVFGVAVILITLYLPKGLMRFGRDRIELLRWLFSR